MSLKLRPHISNISTFVTILEMMKNTSRTFKLIALGLLLLFVSLLVFFMFRKGESQALIVPLTKRWEKTVPFQEIPEGLTSLSAKECGACHQDHYNEWKLSTHANAWTDAQFQAELKKESSPFFCINCHIPLENQQEFIVHGMMDGDIYQPVKSPNFRWDEELQMEGITCAACHVRGNAVVGPTGSKLAPHKTVKDPNHLSESLCLNCHNATAVITPSLACSFETGDEWKVGPYFNEKNCIDCHMEEMERPIVAGYEPRKSRFHGFPGSGIPKHSSLKAHQLNGLAFYPENQSKVYQQGEEVLFSFRVKNENAGHKVPTGDPERFILIEFVLMNEQGGEVVRQTERIGEVWEWYPKAKKVSDNNMKPLEERTYQFKHSGLLSGKYTLKLMVTKHRMDEETAEYNQLGDDYPLFISIYEKDISVQVR